MRCFQSEAPSTVLPACCLPPTCFLHLMSACCLPWHLLLNPRCISPHSLSTPTPAPGQLSLHLLIPVPWPIQWGRCRGDQGTAQREEWQVCGGRRWLCRSPSDITRGFSGKPGIGLSPAELGNRGQGSRRSDQNGLSIFPARDLMHLQTAH